MIVMKFGGTSVGTPDRIKALAPLVQKDEPVLVVLSALSGTTNALADIAGSLYAGNAKTALATIEELEEHYRFFLDTLFENSGSGVDAREAVAACLNAIKAYTRRACTPVIERTILAQGELMSTQIFYHFLRQQGRRPVLLNALDFMRTTEDGDPDDDYIRENLQFEISKYPEKQLFITQGYICRNAYGEVDNLKRGGSDYTASLAGAALDVREIQIWTDIDGMHNNDPRVVSQTRPISELSFYEAAELAYFGAKILHPSSVGPAAEKGIPVRLKNTMQPEAPGTLISNKSDADGFKAVAAKDGIIAIKIRSGRMLLAYGFLRMIFEVFERYRTPIDMITTSEVAVSVTIDDDTHLTEIINDLQNYGTVEVDKEQTIVCIVGNFLQDKTGYAAQIFTALNEIPVRMISYGGSRHNVSILVDSRFKADTLKALNRGIFEIG
jgi:aspartate kinase